MAVANTLAYYNASTVTFYSTGPWNHFLVQSFKQQMWPIEGVYCRYFKTFRSQSLQVAS
jgi:hypothetical protein